MMIIFAFILLLPVSVISNQPDKTWFHRDMDDVYIPLNITGRFMGTEDIRNYCSPYHNFVSFNDKIEYHVGNCDSDTYCANGGTYFLIGDDHKCQCTAGWEGQTCEVLKPNCIDVSKCAHGKYCAISAIERCDTCDPSYHGPLCQDDVNECEVDVCHNGGTCLNSHGSFTCICPVGLTGKCQCDIDECLYGVCGDGACVNTLGSYECHTDDKQSNNDIPKSGQISIVVVAFVIIAILTAALFVQHYRYNRQIPQNAAGPDTHRSLLAPSAEQVRQCSYNTEHSNNESDDATYMDIDEAPDNYETPRGCCT